MIFFRNDKHTKKKYIYTHTHTRACASLERKTTQRSGIYPIHSYRRTMCNTNNMATTGYTAAKNTAACAIGAILGYMLYTGYFAYQRLSYDCSHKQCVVNTFDARVDSMPMGNYSFILYVEKDSDCSDIIENRCDSIFLPNPGYPHRFSFIKENLYPKEKEDYIWICLPVLDRADTVTRRGQVCLQVLDGLERTGAIADVCAASWITMEPVFVNNFWKMSQCISQRSRLTGMWLWWHFGYGSEDPWADMTWVLEGRCSMYTWT